MSPVRSKGFSDTELTGGSTKIFYTHRQFNMLDYIFSTHLRERLSKFSVRSISKADFAEVTLAEALTAYSFLQRADRRLDQSKLFTALHRQGLLTHLNDPQYLERALKWLEIQGLPLLHVGNMWRVNGLAKKRFVSMDVDHWPQPQRKQWLDLQGETSPQAVAKRIYLMKEVHGWTWKEMAIDDSVVSAWLSGQTPGEYTLENLACVAPLS